MSEDATPEREEPFERNHDTYSQDNWRVVDVDGVDKVFATVSNQREGGPTVRVDIDGQVAHSVMNDVENLEPEENINSSIWLRLPDALELLEQVEGAVDELKEQTGSSVGSEDE